jgi:hypothetical protein
MQVTRIFCSPELLKRIWKSWIIIQNASTSKSCKHEVFASRSSSIIRGWYIGQIVDLASHQPKKLKGTKTTSSIKYVEIMTFWTLEALLFELWFSTDGLVWWLGCRLDDQEIEVRFPKGEKDTSVQIIPKTGCRAEKASYPKHTGGSFWDGKQAPR